jgi:hypothetical protein
MGLVAALALALASEATSNRCDAVSLSDTGVDS